MNTGRLAMVMAALLAAACQRGPQTAEAVRQGVLDHLASRSDLDLKGIQVEVTSVSFRENEAEAVVSFRPRSGDPSAGFQMRYTLERQAGRWVVKRRAEAGGPPHGGAMTLPPGHPQLGQPKAGTPPSQK